MLEFTNEQLSRISLVVFTFQNAAFVLLMRGSKLANTHYNSTVAVMVTETLKVPFTVALLCYEKGGVGAACSQMHKDIVLQPMDTLKISIPALLYTVQNNALFVAVENLEAAVFQCTYQLKTLTTAILVVVFLGRSVKPHQWFALMLLMAGTIMVQEPPGAPKVQDDADVIGAAAESGVVDAGMQARLAEHLPTSAQGESVQGSLVTPQVQQVWPLLAWHARVRP